MPTRIRERIWRICAKHARPLQILEGWFLLILVIGGSGAIGYLIGISRAEIEIAQQTRDHQAEQQRLMDINRQLMLIIEQRLPAIAETASGAAEVAKAAAHTARQAASNAGAAGKAARSAASSAKSAAQAVEEAVTPPPRAAPADAPKWLDGP